MYGSTSHYYWGTTSTTPSMDVVLLDLVDIDHVVVCWIKDFLTLESPWLDQHTTRSIILDCHRATSILSHRIHTVPKSKTKLPIITTLPKTGFHF